MVRARRLRDGPNAPDIALKVTRAELLDDPGVTRRFRDEARILERIAHRSVVRADALLEYDGRLALELELVEGATLEKALGALGPVPVPVALAVVRQAAEALVAAWNAVDADGKPMRIVHRDLKPANLALALDGTVKLLDFGYAKGDFEGRAAMSLHDVWGTIGFDAPERKQGEATQKADVYALGVTLFVARTTRAMLISTKAAHHDDDLEGALGHLDGGEGVPDDALRALVRDSMGFDPATRLTMAALIERIDALVDPDEAASALADWCDTRIRELWEGRLVVDARNDEAWDGLAFLETQTPVAALGELSREEARKKLESLMAEPGWPGRVAHADPILDATADPDPTPLVGVLERAKVPFYKPWVSTASDAELEAALLLVNRIDRPLALDWARRLVDHRSERVREVARFVLGD